MYVSNGNVYGDPPPTSVLMTPKTMMFFMAFLYLNDFSDSGDCHDNQEYLVGPNMIRVTLKMAWKDIIKAVNEVKMFVLFCTSCANLRHFSAYSILMPLTIVNIAKGTTDQRQ